MEVWLRFAPPSDDENCGDNNKKKKRSIPDEDVTYDVWVPGNDKIVRFEKNVDKFVVVDPFEGKSTCDDCTNDGNFVLRLWFSSYKFRNDEKSDVHYDLWGKRCTAKKEVGGGTILKKGRNASSTQQWDVCVPFSVDLSKTGRPEDVAIRIRSYTRLPIRRNVVGGHEFDADWKTFQHCADVSIHWGQLRNELHHFSLPLTLISEKIWLKKDRIHEWVVVRKRVSNGGGGGGGAPAVEKKYEEEHLTVVHDQLKRMCREWIGPELKRLRDVPVIPELRRYIQIPPSVRVCGTPWLNDEKIEQVYGLSAQSWWKYDRPVVTEKWFRKRLLECLNVRGHTETDYLHVVSSLLLNDLKDFGALHECLTDALRVCTSYANTRPYVPDHLYSDDGDDEVWISSDDFTSSLTCPGDCEDSAQCSYLIYMTLINSKWKDPLVGALRVCACIVGIPVGLMGIVLNPLSDDEDYVCHMFGAAVPYDILFKTLFGTDARSSSSWRASFRRCFGFEHPKIFKSEKIAPMESTLIVTPYYEHRRNVSDEKKMAYEIVRNWLEEREGGRHPDWNNYTCTIPLDEDGRSTHKYALRLFGDFSNFFFEDEKRKFLILGERGGEIVETTAINKCGSYVLFDLERNRVGVDCRNQLFASNEIAGKIRLVATFEPSKSIWDVQRKLMKSYCRPTVTADDTHQHDVFRGNQDQIIRDRLISNWCMNEDCHVDTSNSNKRITTFVYRVDEKTEEVLKELKRRLNAKYMFVHKYCWCLAVTFIW